MVSEPAVRERIKIIRRADKLLFGVSNIRRESLTAASGLIDLAMVREYQAERATAFIAGRFVDEMGHPCAERWTTGSLARRWRSSIR